MSELTDEQKDYILKKFANLFFRMAFLCIAEEHEGKKKIYISQIRDILDSVFEDAEDRKAVKELYR